MTRPATFAAVWLLVAQLAPAALVACERVPENYPTGDGFDPHWPRSNGAFTDGGGVLDLATACGGGPAAALTIERCDVTWTKDVYPIIATSDTSCASGSSCHGPGDHKLNGALGNTKGVPASSDPSLAVTPDSVWSVLVNFSFHDKAGTPIPYVDICSVDPAASGITCNLASNADTSCGVTMPEGGFPVRRRQGHHRLVARLRRAQELSLPMDRLLARLERRFGWLAIPHLPLILVFGNAIMFVILKTRPDLQDELSLDWDAVRHGEVWRLFTSFFFPNSSSYIFIVFVLMFTWMVANALEQQWGSFRFTVFYMLGAAATIGTAIVFGNATNVWLNLSLFMAFATLFPDTQLYLYVIPMKAKWMALLAVGYMLYQAFPFTLAALGAMAVAFSNYALFFAGHWAAYAKGRNLQVRQAARRSSMGPSEPLPADRACALCGKKQSEGADIRVCSCAKCGGPRNLCLEHARAH